VDTGSPYRGAVQQLAQANVAVMRAPLESPAMRDFVGALEPVNRLAEQSPGFVWRLVASHGEAASVRSDGGSAFVVNLSVWESYEALHAFVYLSPHGAYVRRRSRWFVPATGPSTVLWWVPAGQRPSVEDALRRLRHLRAHGPSPQAFSLRRRFGPDGRPAPSRSPARAART
jgi:hypothetical protein